MDQKVSLIISEHSELAEVFNEFFVSAATNLDIDVSDVETTDAQHINDPILKAITSRYY